MTFINAAGNCNRHIIETSTQKQLTKPSMKQSGHRIREAVGWLAHLSFPFSLSWSIPVTTGMIEIATPTNTNPAEINFSQVGFFLRITNLHSPCRNVVSFRVSTYLSTIVSGIKMFTRHRLQERGSANCWRCKHEKYSVERVRYTNQQELPLGKD